MDREAKNRIKREKELQERSKAYQDDDEVEARRGYNFTCANKASDVALNCYAATYFREQQMKRRAFATDMQVQVIEC